MCLERHNNNYYFITQGCDLMNKVKKIKNKNVNVYMFSLCAVLFIILCVLFFTVFLPSCSNLLYTFGLSEIHYNGIKYTRVYDPNWFIEDEDNYSVKTVEQDGFRLHIKVYDCDKEEEFIYCNDSSALYHDASKSYPKNTDEDMESLILITDNDDIVASEDIIKEFRKVISKKPKYSIERSGNDEDIYCSLEIYYKDYPALYSFGWIEADKNNNYYLFRMRSLKKDEFYPIDKNSILLDYIE